MADARFLIARTPRIWLTTIRCAARTSFDFVVSQPKICARHGGRGTEGHVDWAALESSGDTLHLF